MDTTRASILTLLLCATGCPGNSPPVDTGPMMTLAPVDSDKGAASNGGGCYPQSILPDEFGLIERVNPEWAPIDGDANLEAKPVLIHGVVNVAHGDTGGDFPSTHRSSDTTAEVKLDEADAWRAATGNDAPGEIEIEWENQIWPDWAWPSPGDRVVALGRWIFDCGHPNSKAGTCSKTTAQACIIDDDCAPSACPTCMDGERCAGAHFGYSSEIHPPYATAMLREGRGGIISDDAGAAAVPATRADVYVNPDGGAANDRCVVTRQPTSSDLLFSTECFPFKDPMAHVNAQDFEFDIPLPARPAGAQPGWRIVSHDTPGGVAPNVVITPFPDEAAPRVAVRVSLTQPGVGGGALPTGYAATIYAGWKVPPPSLVHVRVTIDSVLVTNALKPVTPVVHVAKAWRMQARVNGEWQRLVGLDAVSTGDVVPQKIVFDQFLPPDGALALYADGTSQACIDTLYDQSLRTSVVALGLGDGVSCIKTEPKNPGVVEVSYPGPDFGSGGSSKTYDLAGQGADGGVCSATSKQRCIDQSDCPMGETCAMNDNAFNLRFHIEKVL